MRGRVGSGGSLFYTVDLEAVVPQDHPLRRIKGMVDRILSAMSMQIEGAYSKVGRPSIPAEQLIKALLLMGLYSIRSERQLCEQIGYSLLFRWFLDIGDDVSVWDHSTFSKNKDRLWSGGLVEEFFRNSVVVSLTEELASDEHFTVDSSLIRSWASMKSMRRKDDGDSGGGGSGDFRGECRSNETHESVTDPEAQLARRSSGEGAYLSHSMHVVMENRNGLVMDIKVAEALANEREVALELVTGLRRKYKVCPRTLAGDKGYDSGEFLDKLERRYGIIPHVAVRSGRIVSRDRSGQARLRARRRQATVAYQLNQRFRKRVEQIFGWLKVVGGLRKTRYIGRWKIQLQAYTAAAAYNFLRLANLGVVG